MSHKNCFLKQNAQAERCGTKFQEKCGLSTPKYRSAVQSALISEELSERVPGTEKEVKAVMDFEGKSRPGKHHPQL